MPEVNKYTFSEGLLGTQKIGAVMAGNNEVYVRFEKHIFETPGNFSMTLPDWATGYGVLMSGGGGGGRAGDGALSNNRNGGQGGDVIGVWGRLSDPNHMVLSGTIGAGGAGGSSANAYGATGGTTTLLTHASNVYSAAGGTGNPTASSRGGGTTTVRFSDLLCRYFNAPPGSSFTNGPGGILNGGIGQRGGGGGGGNGGIFNNYTKGGRGGHGFVEIYVWGLPRHQGGTVEITLGPGQEARDQFRAALSNRGYNYQTVNYVPFDIELVGTGSVRLMFQGCASLTTAPEMDTSQVTDMYAMFYQCSSLTYVPDMDTSRVTNMHFTFRECSALTTAPNMDTSRVTNMDQMFYNCSSLTHVPDLDTSFVTEMPNMFSGCAALTDGNVRLIGKHPNVNTTSMISRSGLTREPFYRPDGTPYDGSTTDVVQITLGNGYEARDQLIAVLSDRGLDRTKITEIPFYIKLIGTGSAQSLFSGYSSLTSAPYMDTSQVTGMLGMFSGCSSLTYVPDMDTSLVTNMKNMFQGCSKLTMGPQMDTSQVTTMDSMFINCPSLVTIPPMDTSQVTIMTNMFSGCSSLTSVPDLTTSQVTSMSYIFRNCSALTDGNARLIGKHASVTTAQMIYGSGLTRMPFYDTNGNPI